MAIHTKSNGDTIYTMITDINNEVVQVEFERTDMVQPISVWVKEGRGLTRIREGRAIVIYIQTESAIKDVIANVIGYKGWEVSNG